MMMMMMIAITLCRKVVFIQLSRLCRNPVLTQKKENFLTYGNGTTVKRPEKKERVARSNIFKVGFYINIEHQPRVVRISIAGSNTQLAIQKM